MVPNMRWRNAAARRVRKDSPAVPAGCGAPSSIVEGSIFAPKSADTREPTVCLPAGAISAETRADLNNYFRKYKRTENSQEGARKERVRGEGTRRRTR